MPVSVGSSPIAWATLTFMETDGTVRVIEIPAGNVVELAVQVDDDEYGLDLGEESRMGRALAPSRGIKVTVSAARGHLMIPLCRVHGKWGSSATGS